MTWVLKPLKGAYYGTVVYNTETEDVVEFWLDFRKYTPDEVSPREKENGWGADIEWYGDVESVFSLDAAVTFINAMNSKEEVL